VKIACLQETKLTPRSKQPSFSDFTFVRKYRQTGGGGGLAILVNHSIPFVHVDSSAFLLTHPWKFKLSASILEIPSLMFSTSIYHQFHPVRHVINLTFLLCSTS
jgi:hypothetical protein